MAGILDDSHWLTSVARAANEKPHFNRTSPASPLVHVKNVQSEK